MAQTKIRVKVCKAEKYNVYETERHTRRNSLFLVLMKQWFLIVFVRILTVLLKRFPHVAQNSKCTPGKLFVILMVYHAIKILRRPGTTPFR